MKIGISKQSAWYSFSTIFLGVALIFGWQPSKWFLIAIGVTYLLQGVGNVLSNWIDYISDRADKQFKQEID